MALALAVHGGAGLIRRASLSAEREAACRTALAEAVLAGFTVLEAGGGALDAAVAAVCVLEDAPVFNAGRGAVLGQGGRVELDAAVMDGRDRRGGAITAATTPRNPILAAREVLLRTPHVLLAGAGADAFVAEAGLASEAPDYFVTPERRAQYEAVAGTSAYGLDHGGGPKDKDVYGTVGAVACDGSGHVAAATSTGGMVNKRPGRVGDTPILGAGTFAWDRTAAVSGTGHGEPFIRLGVGARISARMELLGETLAQAAERVVHTDLVEVDGAGGVIAVDRFGNVALPFNTAGMFRAFKAGDGGVVVKIW